MLPTTSFLLVAAGFTLVHCQISDYHFRWWHECGVSKYDNAGASCVKGKDVRIHEGLLARSYEFPWVVSIKWSPADDKWDHTCQGTLIHPKWVLTAAQCMTGAPLYSYYAVMGEHDLTVESDIRQTIPVKNHFWNKNWGYDNRFESDIALIELEYDAVLSENVMPACAAGPSHDYVGETAFMAGWGEQHSAAWDLPDQLLCVEEEIITNELCQSANGGITPNMLCSNASSIQGACGGDNGAGLYVQYGVESQRWEVVGLNSWSPGCMTNSPQVFTRVGNYRDWVDQIIAENP